MRGECGVHSVRSAGNRITVAAIAGCPDASRTLPDNSAGRSENVTTAPSRLCRTSIGRSSASRPLTTDELSIQPDGPSIAACSRYLPATTPAIENRPELSTLAGADARLTCAPDRNGTRTTRTLERTGIADRPSNVTRPDIVSPGCIDSDTCGSLCPSTTMSEVAQKKLDADCAALATIV